MEFCFVFQKTLSTAVKTKVCANDDTSTRGGTCNTLKKETRGGKKTSVLGGVRFVLLAMWYHVLNKTMFVVLTKNNTMIIPDHTLDQHHHPLPCTAGAIL